MATSPSAAERRLAWHGIAAAAIVAACMAANVWHAQRTSAAPFFDDGWYLETSVRFYRALTERGLGAFLGEYVAAFKIKAPLISVLPLPFYALFGLSLASAQLVNALMLGVLGLYVYLLGRELYGRFAGLLGVAIAMTLPALFGLSRSFFVENSAAALCTAFVYHLWRSQALKQVVHVRAVGALLGLGLLMKVLFPFYVLGPVLAVLWLRWRENAGEGKGPRAFLLELEAPAKAIALIGGGIALTWYASNAIYVAGYLYRASIGDIASHYGNPNVWSPVVILGYWRDLAVEAVSPYYTALGAVLLVLAAARRQAPGAGTAVLATWLLIPFAFGTVGVNKETRLIAPCLPPLALLLARALDWVLGSSWLGRAGAGLLLVAPALLFAHQTFGGVLPAGRRWSVLAPERTHFSGPPKDAGGWDHAGLVRDVFQACGGKASVVAVGIDTQLINANNLAYFSALEGLPIAFVNYGHMESRVERVVARLEDKGTTHILLVRGLPEYSILQSVRAVEPQLLALIEQGRLPFHRIAEFRPGPGVSATLYERRGDIRLFGAPPPRRARGRASAGPRRFRR